MNASGYGEGQPRLDDDRLPVVMVVLDGLGDRFVPELGGTPSEVASTPVLDRLARRGSSGWHVPFGWGPAPSSELAHWAMWGYADVPFPGRAVLEGLGAGLNIPSGEATTFAALRTSTVCDGVLRVTGRVSAGEPADQADAAALLEGLRPLLTAFGVSIQPLGRGECLLGFAGHHVGDVTDSDPFFEDFHPWLQIRPVTSAAADLAEAMNTVLAQVRKHLLASRVNAERTATGRPAFDVLTTKWTGTLGEVPDFRTRTGVAGAAVTSTRLYRGLARLLGMSHLHLADRIPRSADIAARLSAADELIADGAQFVHVHTKATDEAGHTKQPRAKLEVLEDIDAGLGALEELATRAVVAITGDHATPSVDGVLHTSDPTPFLVVGPTVRPDPVTAFGEAWAAAGWYGRVRAAEMLPLLFSHANRPPFLGHRCTPACTTALPDDPHPMPLT